MKVERVEFRKGNPDDKEVHLTLKMSPEEVCRAIPYIPFRRGEQTAQLKMILISLAIVAMNPETVYV